MTWNFLTIGKRLTCYVRYYHRYREPRIEWDSELYNVNLEFALLVGESDDKQVEPEDPSVIDLVSTANSVIDLISTSSCDSSSYCITKYFGNTSDNGNGSDNGSDSTVNSCDFLALMMMIP